MVEGRGDGRVGTRTDGRTGGQTNGWAERWMALGCVHRWETGGWVDNRWVYGRTDGWVMDGWMRDGWRAGGRTDQLRRAHGSAPAARALTPASSASALPARHGRGRRVRQPSAPCSGPGVTALGMPPASGPRPRPGPPPALCVGAPRAFP